jgi:hypothetical protein
LRRLGALRSQGGFAHKVAQEIEMEVLPQFFFDLA